MEAFPLLEQAMAYFRPGDIVQVTKEVKGTHPNFKRPLKIGDKLLVFKVDRKKGYYSSDTAVSLCYISDDGEQWIDGKCARIAYKGNKDDCLKFLEKHERTPQHKRENQFMWCGLRRQEEVKYTSYIPHHLIRHIKSDYLTSHDGTTYASFKTEDEAFSSVAMAWLRMTPAQQMFFLQVNSLYEIFP